MLSLRFLKDRMEYRCTSFLMMAALLLFALLLPGTAFAQPSSCAGDVDLLYTSGPSFAAPGTTYGVRVELGAGTIQNGNTLTINEFRFELNCANPGLGIPCTDEPGLVSYAGNLDASGCAAAGGIVADDTTDPEEVLFTLNSAVVVPEGTPAACNVEFDITVDSIATSGAGNTPNAIDQATGFNGAEADAQCDNNLTAGTFATGSIPVCPVCGVAGPECFLDSVCNQDTGQCFNPPAPASTACTDTENECAVAGCDGAGTCDQLHAPEPSSTACTDNALECSIAGCDGAGACVQDHTPEPASTACTDTENECSVAGCDGAGNCDQLHAPEPSSTSCTDTENECSVAGCDGAGNCDQLHAPEPSSTACTDTENECSVAGCDGAGNCDQLHAPEPSSTACTDTENECSVAGCDGAGNCDQLHAPEPSSTACTDSGNECAVAGCDGAGNCDQLHAPEPSSTACTDTTNECFIAGCDGAGACNQEHTPAPPCSDPTCEECDPAVGCIAIDPPPDECVGVEICRTPGFWATHGGTEKNNSVNITLEVLGDGLDVCGTIVDNTDLENSMSALEAMCVSIKGVKQRQVVRQLTAAALNCSIGDCSDTHLDLIEECNNSCAAEEEGNYNSCIDRLDCFNNGGTWDGNSCITGLGICVPENGADSPAGDPAVCHDELDCGLGEECQVLESCHDRILCPDWYDDFEFNGSDLCFVPPGPAGSPRACRDARKNDWYVPGGQE